MKTLFSPALSFALFLSSAQAGIVIDSTRVIYPADKREVTLGMTNHADTPRLIQAWIDSGDPEASIVKATVPFIVTPPIFRLDAGKGQTLRILFTGGNVPQDRESVFWLNVQEVQPKPAGKANRTKDYVHFSVRSRLKIFYRPQGLPGSPEQAISALRWHAVDGGLECKNPSAFNVSINNIRIASDADNSGDRRNGMCPAKGTKMFSFKKTETEDNKKLSLSIINDYGYFVKHDTTYTK